MMDKPIYRTVQEPYQELNAGIIYVNGQPQTVGQYVTKYRDKRVLDRYVKVPEQRTLTYKVWEKRPFTEYKWERRKAFESDDLFTKDLSKLKKFLSWGIDPDTRGREKNTPLMVACMRKNKEMVKVLLEFGAEANKSNLDGLTALHLAAMKDHLEIVMLLLRHGAKIDNKTKRGMTPINVAKGESKKYLSKHAKNIEKNFRKDNTRKNTNHLNQFNPMM